jgi:DNA adenine methylase
LTQTAAFTSYSENDFSDIQQVELEMFVERISRKGARVVASNSDPKNVNADDNFFDDLYSKFKIERIFASRAINSKGNGRGKISELLVANF